MRKLHESQESECVLLTDNGRLIAMKKLTCNCHNRKLQIFNNTETENTLINEYNSLN